MNPLEDKCRSSKILLSTVFARSLEYELLPDMNIIKTSDVPS